MRAVVLLLCISSVAFAAGCPGSIGILTTGLDSFSLTDCTLSARTSLPVSIARPATDGEFDGTSTFPEVTLCTDNTYSSCATSVDTQVTIRKSWPSGTVAYYKMAFIVASLSSGSTNYYKVQTQSTCHCGVDQAMTPTQMLSTSSPNYDFDAVIDLHQPYANDDQTTSARTILSNLFQGTVGAMSSGATSITFTVTNGTAPTTPFDLDVWNSGSGSPYSVETFRVTAVSGTPPNLTLTVLPGYEGTAQTSHQSGDNAWQSQLHYSETGPIETTIRIFDPISKLNDMGWQPINMSTFSAGGDAGCATSGYISTSSTCIGNIASTTGWTSNMLVRIQNTNAAFTPNSSTYIQYATVTPTTSTDVTVVVRSPYPSAGVACQSSTSGKIWPDQWEDPTSNSYKSLRPGFVVRFWPSLKKYQIVDFEAENSDTETAQDLHYDLTLTMGYTSPATVYTQTNIWHTYGQAWLVDHYNDPAGTNVTAYSVGTSTVTEGNEFWDGDPTVTPFFPGPVIEGINHSCQYLTGTAVYPNYDCTNTISEAYLAQSYSGPQDDPEGITTYPGNWLPSGVTGTITSGATVTNGLVTITTNTGVYRSRAPAAFAPFRITLGTGATAERFIVLSGWSSTSWKAIRAQDGTTAQTNTAAAIAFANEIGDPGEYDKLMGTGGVSEYSGPNTNWNATWLISQDPRLYLKMLGNARIAGSYALNFREGTSTKRLLRSDCGGSVCASGTGTGLGHFAVGVDRLTWRSESIYLGATSTDQLIPISVTSAQYQASNAGSGCIADSGWDIGYNHNADAFSHAYAVTGTPWYSDRMLGWAAASTVYNGVAAGIGQGPNNSWATFPLLINNRSTAWFARETGLTLRMRAYAAFFAPDNTSDSTASTNWLYDAVAGIEGAHNILASGGGAFGIVGSFQGDPTYDTGSSGAFTWNLNNYYTPQNTPRIDSMLGIYEDLQTNVAWSGSAGSGQAGTYGHFPPGRSIFNRSGGINSPNATANKLYPAHSSGVSVFNVQSGTDSTPSTTVLTTTSSAIQSFSVISAAGNNGGNWQITIPSITGLAVGQRVWVECVPISGICADATAAWSGLGTATIASVDSGGGCSPCQITLNQTYHGDTYKANSADFFPLSIPLVSGGCTALIASIGLPKKVYIDTGTNEEMFYIDSCPTTGPGVDVMNAQISGAESWAAFGAGFGNSYWVWGLGRAYDLGFARVLPTLTYAEHFYVDGINSGSYNPWLFKQGYSCSHLATQGNPAVTTWAQKLSCTNPWMQADSLTNCGGLTCASIGELGTVYRYMDYSFMASAFCTPTGLSGCATAQAWMQANIKPGMLPIMEPNATGQTAPHNIMKNDVLPRGTFVCGITTTGLPDGSRGIPYLQTINYTGCANPVFSKQSGTLPAGLTLSSSGVVSGIPSTVGSPSVFSAGIADVNCTLNNSGPCLESLSIRIGPGPQTGSARKSSAIKDGANQ